MLRRTWLAAIMLVGLSPMALAQTLTRTADSSVHRMGGGVAFLGPVGLSVYGELNDVNFMQGAFAFDRDGDFAIAVDYAYQYKGVSAGAPTLTPYWGLGGIVLHDNENNSVYVRNNDEEADDTDYFGGRIPLGVNFVVPHTPVQLGGELVPTVILAPDSYAHMQGGLNVRVLF